MLKSVVLLGVLAGSSITWLPSSHQDADAVEWVEAGRVEITESRRTRDLNTGAPGTGAFGFRIGRQIAGVLIDRLDRKGIVVFVGMTYPPETRGVLEDVRAEFLVGEGETARWGSHHIRHQIAIPPSADGI